MLAPEFLTNLDLPAHAGVNRPGAHHPAVLEGDLPAHAGVNPPPDQVGAGANRSPRARGGEPHHVGVAWALPPDLPAHAGVNPLSQATRSRFLRISPRTRG